MGEGLVAFGLVALQGSVVLGDRPLQVSPTSVDAIGVERSERDAARGNAVVGDQRDLQRIDPQLFGRISAPVGPGCSSALRLGTGLNNVARKLEFGAGWN